LPKAVDAPIYFPIGYSLLNKECFKEKDKIPKLIFFYIIWLFFKLHLVPCTPNLQPHNFMSNPIVLNAFYDAGNKAGVILAWGTSLLLTAELVYVMFKYVFAKNKE
jgi:hypothetical protein